jgi:2-polyprenyl-3-methyl-5-hydroxy-6-metoxy-1,4-benzoquinol methylase
MSQHEHHTEQHSDTDPSAFFTQTFWDERYSSAPMIWSGNPNVRLVEQAASLTPGAALDVGSGEGADAIWLASLGWRVTGVDVSTVALERSAMRAAEAGAEIAGRITWKQADILTWEPTPEQFDLVSAQFMQLPGPERESLHRRLAAAVRPGGALLIVGHHPSDMETSVRRPKFPDLFFTAEQIAETLDESEWEIIAADAPGREATDPEGRTVTIHDTVFHALRRR